MKCKLTDYYSTAFYESFFNVCIIFFISLVHSASNEVERQSWVTALELAKAKAIRAIESEEEEEDNTVNAIPSEELNTVVRDLTIK